MITLDTNVVLRLFLNENPKMQAEVEAFFTDPEKDVCYVSSYSLLEFVWVLRKNGFERAKIATCVEQLLADANIVFGNRRVVEQALTWYRLGKADFADYLIHADGVSVGAREIVTFDEAFAREDKRRKRPQARRKRRR